ncbi:MAG: ECF RNA polymerase sigma factor SigW [Firmicutes bacterium]|nr:ECF RNA polymerase sigma factor SigW [candidate division NPL-UPA2 bacterium]
MEERCDGVLAADTDQKLVQRSLAGDTDAFRQIVERYQSKVYNLALRMTGNPEDALDISQESFIRVFRSLKTFKGDSSFSTWLYRIANNIVLDELRKRRRRPLVVMSTDAFVSSEEGEHALEFSGPQSLQPEEQVMRAERRREIAQALQAISPEHRLILLLRDVEGLSYEEIAGVQNINVGTVKSRLNRARLALREHLLRVEQISAADVHTCRREAK